MPRRNRGRHFPGPRQNVTTTIAAELMRERGIEPPAHFTEGPPSWFEHVGIGHLWKGHGMAYVRLSVRARTAVVHFGPTYWKCSMCGNHEQPVCPHARLVPDSPALKRATASRPLNQRRAAA